MFLLINKPKGMTSHDVIDEIRKITGISKVGHAGTLDPNATGLLIVGVGRQSTKKLGEISKNTTKTYIAEIILGEERDTDDVLGKVRNSSVKVRIKVPKSKIEKVLESFLGEQEQMPPDYSAIKIKGNKAYEFARKGKSLHLKVRKINIHYIKLIRYNYPLLKVKVKVSSGTYIRALARDIGRNLGCGAYLKDLVRTEIGDKKLEIAASLDILSDDNWKKFAVEFN